MSLRTVETAPHQQIELSFSEVVLFTSLSASPGLPSSVPFVIPLAPDTPQSVRTPLSSLFHALTATLHPKDPLLPTFSRTITVHVRRYTPHSHTIAISPETYNTDDPTRVEIEIPRSVFRVDEPIPIYVAVPPPRRELVVDQALSLRNIRAELVRMVDVKHGDGPSTISHSQEPSSSKAHLTPPFSGQTYRMVIAQSGASCRFHSTKSVQLRLILHPTLPHSVTSDVQLELPAGEYGHLESEIEYASITQTTLLHSVSFWLNVHVSFVNTSNRTERFSTVTIPVVIIPAPAPLPEVEEWLGAAYHKKHDRPPVKTTRRDDADPAVPHDEGEAGPSVPTSGAPPPFEERDAPPPFQREASTSTRLPTFLESESEILVPVSEEVSIAPLCQDAPAILGEGIQFGFPLSEQFDGHLNTGLRSENPASLTGPTSLPMLASNRQPELEVMGRSLTLEQHRGTTEVEPPAALPLVDDPSDPPPSIDSEFRFPTITLPTPLDARSGYGQTTEAPSLQVPSPTGDQASHGQAPPPYLIPDNDRDGHVARPPPYVDFSN
jgi:hypothetical protein